MEIELTGRIVIVTGASRGIGRTIAETFAAEGAVVVGLDVLSPEGDPGLIDHRHCDITDLSAVTEALDDISRRHGGVDVLVNNAGVNAEGSVDTVDPALWDRAFDVNVRGVFNACRAVIPHMKEQRSGRIINAASFAAIVPSVNAAAYGATKAAVVQFTRVLASELGPWNITANAYAPGMIPTDINGFALLEGDAARERLDLLSLRRWGDSADVAQLLCFLASDLAGYITGALIDISGGKLATQAPALAYQRSGAETSMAVDI